VSKNLDVVAVVGVKIILPSGSFLS